VVSVLLAFGNYDPSSASPNDSSGNVQVTCTAVTLGLTVSYVIKLSAGNGASFSPRKMASGGNNLNYNIYTDAGHSSIWGDGTGGTSTVSDSYSGSILTRTLNYTVYGRIPASQNAAVGVYGDSITVTVEY
jgi:spore coat protein U-like protein